MSFHKAIHDGCLAIYTADTGGTGLNNSASAAYVRFWGRSGDANIGEDRSPNWPYVESEVVDDSTMDAFGKDASTAHVRLHVYTQRDNTQNSGSPMDDVFIRLRAVFNDAVLATSGGWIFTPIAGVRRIKAPHTGSVLHEVMEFRVVGSTV